MAPPSPKKSPQPRQTEAPRAPLALRLDRAAGGSVVRVETGAPMRYAKHSFKNDAFLAWGRQAGVVAAFHLAPT